MSQDFSGKVVVVTGASKGIGAAIAVAFAKAGATVVGLARGDQSETARNAGAAFEGFHFDAEKLDAAGAKAVVAGIVEKHGRIDVLVNNAGTIRRAPAHEHPESDWQAVMQINLTAPFLLAQAVGAWWIREGAEKAPESARLKIVNIASLLSFQGGINVISYTASKHGIAGVTKALANEWASKRINVNALAPGYIETDNTAPLRADPDRSASILGRIPEGRWGKPEDIAATTLFLSSSGADYLNGTVLNVDGGWMGR
jgi:2-deoxy-D-gluconate 3-dehydrogenase